MNLKTTIHRIQSVVYLTYSTYSLNLKDATLKLSKNLVIKIKIYIYIKCAQGSKSVLITS